MPNGGIQIEIGKSIEMFRWHQSALQELLAGPVTQDLARRAIRVESAAKINATGRPGPNVITGRLRGSITWRLGADAEGPYADIGTAVFYAPFVEKGTSRAPAYPFLVPALQAAR